MTNRIDVLTKIDNLIVEGFKRNNRLEEKTEKMSVPIETSLMYLLYSFDKNLPSTGLFPFFKKTQLAQSMCDYIIFCFNNNKLFALLIELKHGKNNVTKQLAAGKCFVNFIVDSLNRIENLNLQPEIRSISVRDKNIIRKRTTKIRDVKYEDEFCTFIGNVFRLKEFLK